MNIMLSMPTSEGPQWMVFLLPIVALLLIVEGTKRFIHWMKHRSANKHETEV